MAGKSARDEIRHDNLHGVARMTEQPKPIGLARVFIDRWKRSGAAERANYALFLAELCDVFDVPRPEPTQADESRNGYVFEKAVTFRNSDSSTTQGRIDLYKKDCFVLEAKQGVEKHIADGDYLSTDQVTRRKAGTAIRGTRGWDEAMIRARGQAEQYAKALPEWPPFLIVVDVGHSIELYSDFERMGKGYLPFPEPRTHRIYMDDLERPEVIDRLRCIWTDPMSLDPSRYAANVTREVADRLALLAKSLESEGHPSGLVADFLMRCLFTMFAEDVGLLERESFSGLLAQFKDDPGTLGRMLASLWKDMDHGGFSAAIRGTVLRFNGRFFRDQTTIPLNSAQASLLAEAARSDWSSVEPAIFGTLIERALDPRERHILGAHYTPRAYVERLVHPTIIEPLRAEWDAVRAVAMSLESQVDSGGVGASAKHKEAVQRLREFHTKLCSIRVLDPACGTGNFLYVTLDHMKRLEGEVLQMLHDLGESQEKLGMLGVTVDPHQFLGIEINPRAAAIAELVLWLGYLQWHFRTHGNVNPPEPVLRDLKNIECRDAVLAYDKEEVVLDQNGKVRTRWDGVTYKPHPVTGIAVPDENAQTAVLHYLNPRRAEWPEADYIVGNPPFVGNWRMRETLGDGYAETLRATYDDVPESCDFVMYWWNQAARRMRRREPASEKGTNHRGLRRFGFIATNSLRQKFSRQVLQPHLDAEDGISLVFAIPDHPWVDTADGAAVRISMTVADRTPGLPGRLLRVAEEREGKYGEAVVTFDGAVGRIHSNLTVGADVGSAVELMANAGLSCPGVKLHGAGFIVSPEEAIRLGLGSVPGLEKHIRPYRNGRDIAQTLRGDMVIDLFGLTAEEVQKRFPAVYQWVFERVKPERDQNNRATYRENWWRFGEPRANFRPALDGLSRYIATVETSKHRFFVFLDAEVLPDNMLVNIALDDAFCLGVLSSRVHVVWALAAGGRLGVGNDPRYTKSRCFDAFPFPNCDEQKKARIREVAEALDLHRKTRQAAAPQLTMTAMYNVLEKLRTGDPLTAPERGINEQGLCSVLRQLHDDLDAAVFEAYGWAITLSDDEILERLVALNRECVEDESRGTIHWLRPDYQKRHTPEQTGIAGLRKGKQGAVEQGTIVKEKQPWPAGLVERVQAVRSILLSQGYRGSAASVAGCFKRAPIDAVAEILDALCALGQARRIDSGEYTL